MRWWKAYASSVSNQQLEAISQQLHSKQMAASSQQPEAIMVPHSKQQPDVGSQQLRFTWEEASDIGDEPSSAISLVLQIWIMRYY